MPFVQSSLNCACASLKNCTADKSLVEIVNGNKLYKLKNCRKSVEAPLAFGGAVLILLMFAIKVWGLVVSKLYL